MPLDGDVELNAGRETVTVVVANSGDRPVQVGSHFHFFEVNDALAFDRAAARGFRLDIAAGTAVRFEPGQSRTVGSSRSPATRRLRLQRRGDGPARSEGEATDGDAHRAGRPMPRCTARPTGDRVRLADTALVIEVEHDHTILRRGGEVRRRQGDPRRHGPEPADVEGRRRHRHHQRADRRPLGHRQGRHRRSRTAASRGIGKAGNPDIQPGVDIVIGPGTEIIAGEGMIVTPAASTATSTSSARSRSTKR